MKKILLLSVLLVGGCETLFPQVKYLYDGPYGPVYETYCHGTFKSLGDCYQQAGQICGGNFEIMNKSEKSYRNLSSDPWGDPYSSTEEKNINKATQIKRSVIFYCIR